MIKKLHSSGAFCRLVLSSDRLARAFTAKPVMHPFRCVLYLILATLFASRAHSQVVQDRSAAHNMAQKLGNGLAYGSNLWKYEDDNFYHNYDFVLARQYGFNHVRINARMQNMQVLDSNGNPTGVLTNSAMNQLVDIIDDALANDLLVVICPFFWWSHPDNNPNGADVFTDADIGDLASMWEQIALRCQQEGYSLEEVVFELYEEPEDNHNVEDLIRECVDAITAVQNRYIVIPGWGFLTIEGMGRVFDQDLIPLDYPRLMGTFHFYEPKCQFANPGVCGIENLEPWPNAVNDEERLREWFQDLEDQNSNWAARNGTVNLPIYMGEFGTRNKAWESAIPRDERRHWIWWTRMVAEEFGYTPVYWRSYGQNGFGLGLDVVDLVNPEGRDLVDPADPTGTDEEVIRQALIGRYQAEDPNSVPASSSDAFVTGSDSNTENQYLSFQGVTAASGSFLDFNDVYVGTSGTYNLTIRFSNADGVDLNLDLRTEGPGGNTITNLQDVPFAQTGAGTWYSKTIPLHFNAGINKVQLSPTALSGDLRIDFIALTQVNKLYVDSHYTDAAVDDRTEADPEYFAFPIRADVHAYLNDPDTNFGAASILAVRQASNWAREAYLKFDVAGLSAEVDSVFLKVYSETEVDAVNALSVINQWSELGLTWNNRPASGGVIGTGQASLGQWFEIDVTDYVTGNGQYSFVLSEQGNTKHDLGSKEGGRGAYLEIRVKPDPDVFPVGIDAHVYADFPDTNYGTSSILAVRQTSAWARDAYLRFNVTGLSSSFESAVLVVYSETEVDAVNALRVNTNNWSETGLTWNNRPAVGALLGSAQASPGQWFEIDVSSFVTGNGVYTFVLQEQGNTKHDLGSKEGGSGAYLEIRY